MFTVDISPLPTCTWFGFDPWHLIPWRKRLIYPASGLTPAAAVAGVAANQLLLDSLFADVELDFKAMRPAAVQQFFGQLC